MRRLEEEWLVVVAELLRNFELTCMCGLSLVVLKCCVGLTLCFHDGIFIESGWRYESRKFPPCDEAGFDHTPYMLCSLCLSNFSDMKSSNSGSSDPSLLGIC